jgi:uncharacterized membrane protein (DUF106 family)
MPFIGSIILELIGAFCKWSFLTIKHIATGRKRVSFQQIFDGSKDSDFKESIEHGLSNILLGWIVVFIVCSLLVLFFT